MPTDIRNKEKEREKEASSKLITDYLEKNQKSIKRTSSTLSPPDSNQQLKKQNTLMANMLISHKSSADIVADQGNTQDMSTVPSMTQDTIKDAIAPIISEIQLLRESVHSDYNKLHADYVELKESITTKSNEIAEKLNLKIDANTEKISQMINENKLLCRENASLKDRISKIESNQVRNNIIISGIPESKLEPYDTTVARIHDTIATAFSSCDIDQALEEARSIKIICCNRIGRYQMGRNRPISATLRNYGDKEKIMQHKKDLPNGIYINEEFPLEVKCNRDKLRPIWKLAKNHSEYRDKCKLSGDRLVINGINYTVNDLHNLPEDLAPYKAAQQDNHEYIAFHGEHSPWSNFHPSPFVIDGQCYRSTQQWIQFSKAMLFGESSTANKMLQADSLHECKHLSYQMNGVNNEKWRADGFELCLKGVEAKFKQNKELWSMLKMTEPKILVEASTDRLWGTGISLKDTHVLDSKRWYRKGSLSDMLHTVRESYQKTLRLDSMALHRSR